MNNREREAFEKWWNNQLAIAGELSTAIRFSAWNGWHERSKQDAQLIAELVKALARVPSALMITHNAQIGAFIRLNEIDYLKRLLAKVRERV